MTRREYRHRMTYPYTIVCDEHRYWKAYGRTAAEARLIADEHGKECSTSIVRR